MYNSILTNKRLFEKPGFAESLAFLVPIPDFWQGTLTYGKVLSQIKEKSFAKHRIIRRTPGFGISVAQANNSNLFQLSVCNKRPIVTNVKFLRRAYDF